MQHNSGVKFGDLQVAFGHDTLMLSDLITVFLIRDNIGKRPIYFAWSDGNVPDQTLGLVSYLTTEGMVRRLNPARISEGGPIVFNRALGFVDLPRTRQLLFGTYDYDAAARARPRGWVDRPSQSILSLYSVIYGTTAVTFKQAADTTLAIRADSIARAVEANLK